MANKNKSKKPLRRLFCVLLAVFALISTNVYIFASEGTTYTMLVSADGNKFMRTQDAYLPGGTYLRDIGLNSPEDMYLHEGKLYIADTGNARIVIYEINTGALAYVGDGLLSAPTGISVASDGRIFVADYGASEIVVLSSSGKELLRIKKPQEVIYGFSPYKPQKVATDSFGNIFALSEGTYEGLLQFNSDGAFNGFFGANKSRSLSFTQWFQKIFYTDEQKSKMFFHTPPNIAALDVSSDNLIYNVTQNDRFRSLKKLNLAGMDIFANSNEIIGEKNFVDVTVSPAGNVFAITDTGSISEFDNEGILLVMFGGRASASDRNGLTAVVSAIEVDESCNLYILDKERGLVQTYYPTATANLIHKAYADFSKGDYEQSLQSWGELLKISPNTFMAHLGYGNSLFQLGRYEEAAEHFAKLNRGDLYSDCYFEIRSEWLRSNMAVILICGLILAVILFVLWVIRQRYDYMRALKNAWSNLKKRYRIFEELFVDTKHLLKHPIDCYYDLKHETRGSVAAASILYVLALIVYIGMSCLSSFVFTNSYWFLRDPLTQTFYVVFPVILFVIGSYLISSINNGEGSFKNAYIACGYMLTPYIIFTPIMLVVSHIMTLKELFIYDFCNFLIIGYTLVLLFLAVKETHCYTPKKTIANLLLTLAFIVITVVALVVLYILWKELVSFIFEIFEEVRYRVTS